MGERGSGKLCCTRRGVLLISVDGDRGSSKSSLTPPPGLLLASTRGALKVRRGVKSEDVEFPISNNADSAYVA